MLLKDAKVMLSSFRGQVKAMNTFIERLQSFQFDCIGENLTDDEKVIGKYCARMHMVLFD